MLPTKLEDARSSGSLKKPVISAREFRACADRQLDVMVLEMRAARAADPVLAFLHAQQPRPAAPGALQRQPIADDGPAPRFLRDWHVFLHPLRFGRLRLFLSRFVGSLAWKGWAR